MAPAPSATARITLGIAGSNGDPTLIVAINGAEVGREKYAHNKLVSRAASHSAEYMESVYPFPGPLLQTGTNTVTLSMAKGMPTPTERVYYPKAAIGYDTIHLEVDDTTTDTDRDALPDFWELEQVGRLSALAGAGADCDGDGVSDADEYAWRTDPADPTDLLVIVSNELEASGYSIEWNSQVFLDYRVEWSTDHSVWHVLPAIYQGTGGALRTVVDPRGIGNPAGVFFRVIPE